MHKCHSYSNIESELIIGKSGAYGQDKENLKFFHENLTRRKQLNKDPNVVNGWKSCWLYIQFNIKTYMLQYFIELLICTLYVGIKCLK